METSDQNVDQAGDGVVKPSQQFVYVVPDRSLPQPGDDEIDLTDFFRILWWGKWIILSVSTFVAIVSVIYALNMTHWYRSEVLLAPAEAVTANQGIAGPLGNLAGLAGISVGGGGSAEALAVLRSRDFTRAFIEDQNLITVLFKDQWDDDAGRWIEDDPNLQPDMRDAVRYFGENIRRISEDLNTGLVTVAVEWPDPELAAKWVTLLVERLNDHMRSRALMEAEANVEYLQAELGATSVVALQQSIGRLLEGEMQKLMLARGNEEFAFRIIDGAEVPRTPSRPSRRLFVMVAVAAGGCASVLLVLGLHFIRRRLPKKADSASDQLRSQ